MLARIHVYLDVAFTAMLLFVTLTTTVALPHHTSLSRRMRASQPAEHQSREYVSNGSQAQHSVAPIQSGPDEVKLPHHVRQEDDLGDRLAQITDLVTGISLLGGRRRGLRTHGPKRAVQRARGGAEHAA